MTEATTIRIIPVGDISPSRGGIASPWAAGEAGGASGLTAR